MLEWAMLAQLLLALQEAQSQPEIKYYTLKDPNPEPSLAWFVLNAFFLVAVVVGATLALGIAFGSFRVWLMSRFPNNRFNGAPPDDPVLSFRLTEGAAPEPDRTD